MISYLVTYPRTDGDRFDADYYVAHHIPLVRESWTRYGLTKATALIPEEATPAYAAIAVLEFRDAAALDAALASTEAPAVFGDVVNFTDIAPFGVRCAAR